MPREHIDQHLRGQEWVELRSRKRKSEGAGPLLPPLVAGKCRLDTSVGPRLDCVFLGPGGLCDLHARIGEEAKPPACRQFPFHFTERDGVVVPSLDPACRAVAAGHGPPVLQAEIDAMLTRSHIDKATPVEELRAGTPVDAAAAALRIAAVTAILRSDLPIERRLREAFCEASGLGMPTRPAADPLGRRLLLAFVLLLFRNAWDQKAVRGPRARLRRSFGLLRLAAGLLLGGGSLAIEARGIEVVAGEVDARPFDPDAPTVRPVFDRWLREFPDRADWGPSLGRTLGALLVTYLFARFFSLAVAGSRAPTEDDAISGLTLAEKVAGPRLLSSLPTGSLVARTLAGLYERPQLAPWVLGA